MKYDKNHLTIDGLEKVYDSLANAIDKAGEDKTKLFLVKLALLNANIIGDSEVFSKQIEAALLDL